MKRASYRGAGRVEITDDVIENPGDDEVQIEVAYTGLCGTDLHIVHGHMDHRVTPGQSIGHECSGTVAAVGAGVTYIAVGDRVTVMPLDWDGTCPACLAGHQHICHHLNFIGIDSPGSLQERWTVPAFSVVPLPPELSLRDAALAEPVSVAVHDVRRSGLQHGERAYIIGGGPIGVLIALVARDLGAHVVVAETDPERRALIAELGFVTVDPVAVDPISFVEQWTAGAGADVVFEVSGSAAAVSGATALAKVRGVLVIVAIHPQPREIDLQRVFWRELTLLGARVYERRDVQRAVELLSAGVIPTDRLISAEYPLSDVSSAFEALERGGVMKVLVAGAEATR